MLLLLVLLADGRAAVLRWRTERPSARQAVHAHLTHTVSGVRRGLQRAGLRTQRARTVLLGKAASVASAADRVVVSGRRKRLAGRVQAVVVLAAVGGRRQGRRLDARMLLVLAVMVLLAGRRRKCHRREFIHRVASGVPSVPGHSAHLPESGTVLHDGEGAGHVVVASVMMLLLLLLLVVVLLVQVVMVVMHLQLLLLVMVVVDLLLLHVLLLLLLLLLLRMVAVDELVRHCGNGRQRL